MGIFLPNQPVENEEIEDYLGKIHDKGSATKKRILDQNGIKRRYFALNREKQSTHTNATMAANAIHNALARGGVRPDEVTLLVTGTTQADLPVPGFASMVHAALDIPKC